jgi:hypothetical protein
VLRTATSPPRSRAPPGSGLRKRLKEAERIAGNPDELGARKVELEKVEQQIKEAKAQRNAVLAAARKDPTGASIKDMQAEIDQARKDRRAAEADLAEVQERHNALRAAVCPFPKPHEALVAQGRPRPATGLCTSARRRCRTATGWSTPRRTADPAATAGRSARGRGARPWTAQGPPCGRPGSGSGTRSSAPHREAVRHAEKRLAELEGPVPLRSVLLAAVETLGWTAAAGDPEDWAIREGAKLAADRKSLSDLRSIMVDAEKREAVLVKERATLIGDLQDIALEVDPGLGGEALLERIRQIVHDAAACEQHRRQVDAIDADLGRVLGERGEGLTLESRLAELAEQRDMWRKAAEPVLPSDGPQPAPRPPTARRSPRRSRTPASARTRPDMQRIRDLLHERRVRLAVRDGRGLLLAGTGPGAGRRLLHCGGGREVPAPAHRRGGAARGRERGEGRAPRGAARRQGQRPRPRARGVGDRRPAAPGSPRMAPFAHAGTASAWKVIEGAAWQVGLADWRPRPLGELCPRHRQAHRRQVPTPGTSA